MGSANLENYGWLYVHKDDWDQDEALLETDYDIQIHCLRKGINSSMVLLKVT